MASAIRPEKILKELDELWVGLGQESEGVGVLRACAMTLIVITRDEEGDAVGETLAKLMREHPSRLIVLRVKPGEEASLSERVLAQCWMPFGGRQQICCEQIEITVTDAGLKDVPAVVRALEAPDLPVVIWTRVPGLLLRESGKGLLDLADKVIIDSQGWPQTREKIQAIRNGIMNRRVADLEWTRLTRWRQMLAQEFDNPAYLNRLGELQAATVAYDGAFIPMRALYMGGWLRSVLGPKVAITMCKSGEAETPRLHTVTLSGGSLHFEMNVEQTRASEMTMCNQKAHPAMPSLDEYDLMREELSVTGRDKAFENSLSYAEENAQ
jgi:glucose-6-phosphate dehydrogenase assembly protein OpcA